VRLEQEERVTPTPITIVKWLLVVWQLLVLLVNTSDRLILLQTIHRSIIKLQTFDELAFI